MKIKLKIVFTTLFMLTASMAVNAIETYVGIGGTTGSGTYGATAAISNFTVSASTSYDSSSVPVKIGRILANNNRLEVSYQSISASSGGLSTETISGGNIDYKLFTKDTSLGKFTPYGLIGMGLYEWENTAQYFVGNDNLFGVSWNVGVGGVYGMNENIEIEVTAQYKQIFWQDIKVGSVTITSDNSGTELYLGLNYKL